MKHKTDLELIQNVRNQIKHATTYQVTIDISSFNEQANRLLISYKLLINKLNNKL